MFDDRLEKLREEKGLNKKEAAKQLDMAYTTYLGYEKNEREPNSEALIKIANFFDVDVDYLLGITPYKRSENSLAAKELGLSEQAIQTIRLIAKEDKSQTCSGEISILNSFLTSKNFLLLIQFIETYITIFSSQEYATDVYDKYKNIFTEKGINLMAGDSTDVNEFKEFQRKRMSDLFLNVVDEMDYYPTEAYINYSSELYKKICTKQNEIEISDISSTTDYENTKKKIDEIQNDMDKLNSVLSGIKKHLHQD